MNKIPAGTGATCRRIIGAVDKQLQKVSCHNLEKRDIFMTKTNAIIYGLTALSMIWVTPKDKNVTKEDKRYVVNQALFETAINLGLALTFSVLLQQSAKFLVRNGIIFPHGLSDTIKGKIEKQSNLIKLMLCDKNKLKDTQKEEIRGILKPIQLEMKGLYRKDRNILLNFEKSLSSILTIVGTILAYETVSIYIKNVLANRVRNKQNNAEIKPPKNICLNWTEQHQNWKCNHHEIASLLNCKKK